MSTGDDTGACYIGFDMRLNLLRLSQVAHLNF